MKTPESKTQRTPPVFVTPKLTPRTVIQPKLSKRIVLRSRVIRIPQKFISLSPTEPTEAPPAPPTPETPIIFAVPGGQPPLPLADIDIIPGGLEESDAGEHFRRYSFESLFTFDDVYAIEEEDQNQIALMFEPIEGADLFSSPHQRQDLHLRLEDADSGNTPLPDIKPLDEALLDLAFADVYFGSDSSPERIDNSPGNQFTRMRF